jgi:Heparinase II/III-like protein/Heparinase II/III N-terminus
MSSLVESSRLDSAIRRLRLAGPRGIAEAVRRRTTERAGAHLREQKLRRRPLRVDPAELRTALGGVELGEALRGSALAALPTVAAFERSLTTLDPASRQELLERADEVAAHRFDLLGSGPVDLGPKIDWSRDFTGDYVWPMKQRSLIELYVPGTDMKAPWEISRFQHLPLLAAAFRLSGERRYLDEIGAQLDDWIGANPVELGVNWVCTMDVAIRASNWVAALVLVAPEATAEPWAERAAASLLLHGRFIRTHLEYAPVRGNHYLSDVVGLLLVAALFAGSEEGRDWARWAAGQLAVEMEHEVRSDGCDHEASIPYHRLVAELFVCGTQAADALAPGSLPGSYRQRLEKMLDFIAAYTRGDGLAPQIGDNDDGRFLPLGDYGRADFRSHLHVFAQAGREYEPATQSAAFPESGYFIFREGEIYVLVRCGDNGLGGLGGHAHNDQLSFELCYRDQPLIEDPGTYVYYHDARLRRLFRSTSFHATLQVDDEEQNPIPEWPRFPMGDRTRAEALEWQPDGPRPTFAGRHHGFEQLAAPARYERRFELDPEAATLTLTDVVTSAAGHQLEWSFPLGRSLGVSAGAGLAEVEFEGVSLRIEAPGLGFAVRDAWYSPRYGVKEPRQFLGAKATSEPGRNAFELRLRILDPSRG